MSTTRSRSRSSRRSSRGAGKRRHGNVGSGVKAIHDLTWNWMTKALSELREIAKEAREASKRAVTLADKVALQRVAKRAEAGHAAIARVFGD